MKKIYISLSLLMAMTVAAQNKDTETADKLYAKFEYLDAAKAYEKLAAKGKDAYVYKQIADSYYNLFNAQEASKWYAKLIEIKQQDSETYYRYAQMLKVEGKYEEANKQMQKFASLAPQDQRAVEFKQDPDYLPKLKSQTKLYDEKKLDINDPKYADFGGFVTDDNTFYFASTRNTARRKYGRNEEPYMDIYTATYNNGSFSEPEPLSDLNTQWHDGPATVTGDGNTMYFASESWKEGSFEKDTPGQRTGLIYLFVATKENGKWGNVKAVPFNDKKYSTGNPSVSKDGKTLYFASNRQGSMGGSTDIWKVNVLGNNTYSKPENLGPKVNTEGRENFPFITDDNKLFFASEGRKGFGGMDIFMIDLNKGTEAINLGLPVNSPKDDFAFTFNDTKNIGFFSSNKAGKDNLYLATPICGVEAIVTVKDAKTGKILGGATVAILDDRNNVIQTTTADANGIASYSVDCDRAYVIQASKDGYLQSTFPVSKSRERKVNITADLTPVDVLIVGNEVKLKDIYFEYNKSNITPEGAAELDKLVSLMKSMPNMVIMAKAHTDSRGSAEYNMALSDRRAKAMAQYVISKGIDASRLSGKGYGESEPKVNCGENCTEEQHALNRRIEFIIVKK
ncbi:OmpA family protein [Flavobacterium sp. AG291]|uniref:OmpA family protein n=1 Tax=Flavobacterium sp. AG291 TaxID=2184000 RepID=UPI000E0B2663|nr:OmpA family protein [Flavobacterium sp. AG291]RDI08607.1 outer membrane protein OmpA-like peptidoglycan-associated protein [Flavobacterium sp. AG291]